MKKITFKILVIGLIISCNKKPKSQQNTGYKYFNEELEEKKEDSIPPPSCEDSGDVNNIKDPEGTPTKLPNNAGGGKTNPQTVQTVNINTPATSNLPNNDVQELNKFKQDYDLSQKALDDLTSKEGDPEAIKKAKEKNEANKKKYEDLKEKILKQLYKSAEEKRAKEKQEREAKRERRAKESLDAKAAADKAAKEIKERMKIYWEEREKDKKFWAKMEKREIRKEEDEDDECKREQIEDEDEECKREQEEWDAKWEKDRKKQREKILREIREQEEMEERRKREQEEKENRRKKEQEEWAAEWAKRKVRKQEEMEEKWLTNEEGREKYLEKLIKKYKGKSWEEISENIDKYLPKISYYHQRGTGAYSKLLMLKRNGETLSDWAANNNKKIILGKICKLIEDICYNDCAILLLKNPKNSSLYKLYLLYPKNKFRYREGKYLKTQEQYEFIEKYLMADEKKKEEMCYEQKYSFDFKYSLPKDELLFDLLPLSYLNCPSEELEDEKLQNNRLIHNLYELPKEIQNQLIEKKVRIDEPTKNSLTILENSIPYFWEHISSLFSFDDSQEMDHKSEEYMKLAELRISLWNRDKKIIAGLGNIYCDYFVPDEVNTLILLYGTHLENIAVLEYFQSVNDQYILSQFKSSGMFFCEFSRIDKDSTIFKENRKNIPKIFKLLAEKEENGLLRRKGILKYRD